MSFIASVLLSPIAIFRNRCTLEDNKPFKLATIATMLPTSPYSPYPSFPKYFNKKLTAISCKIILMPVRKYRKMAFMDIFFILDVSIDRVVEIYAAELI